jgi:Flp pilus assembly protein TadG
MNASHSSDSGAAAVEFALVVPLLMAIIIGTVEFGFRYQQKIEYTNAAMQAARTMSIKNDQVAATAEVTGFTGNSSDVVTFSSGGCTAPNTTVQVSVVGNPASLTHLFGGTFTVRAKGKVRCE